MDTQTIVFLLAAGFFVALIIAAAVMGRIRRKASDFTPAPVRFVPHRHLMLMLGLALLVILAAILVPMVVRVLKP